MVTMGMYLLVETAFGVLGKDKPARAHPHRTMIIAVAMTLVAAAAVLYERGY